MTFVSDGDKGARKVYIATNAVLHVTRPTRRARTLIHTMGQGREAEVALVIDELQEAFPGSSVALLTRTGSLYAGRVPPDVNRETFAAMMAVMHGASETGTAELGEELVTAELRLTNGAVFVVGAGKKMLLCAHFKDGAALDGSRAKLSSAAARLGALF